MSNDCGCSCRSYFTGIHSLQQAEKLLVEQFEQRKKSPLDYSSLNVEKVIQMNENYT